MNDFSESRFQDLPKTNGLKNAVLKSALELGTEKTILLCRRALQQSAPVSDRAEMDDALFTAMTSNPNFIKSFENVYLQAKQTHVVVPGLI